MIFIERLGFAEILWLFFNGRQARYAVKSLSARVAERFIPRLRNLANVSKIDFCDVKSAQGIRRCAYKNAEDMIENLPGKGWAHSLEPILGIDFLAGCKKIFFR